MASVPQGALHQSSVFWHIYGYPSRADADAAKGPRDAVVEGLGKTWLFTISPSVSSHAAHHVADVGPLHVKPDADYTARYMVAVFTPGMNTPVHVHSGPEAWYTLSGRVCLETPDGKATSGAGETTIIPEGPPMKLTAIGTETRRSLVLVLHESAKPASTMVGYWKPEGLCK